MATQLSFAEKVAGNVRALAAQNNVSNQQIAETIERGLGAVSARMNGRREFTLHELELLAELFGLEDPAEITRNFGR